MVVEKDDRIIIGLSRINRFGIGQEIFPISEVIGIKVLRFVENRINLFGLRRLHLLLVDQPFRVNSFVICAYSLHHSGRFRHFVAGEFLLPNGRFLWSSFSGFSR